MLEGCQFIHDRMRSGTGILNASSAVFRKKMLLQLQGVYRDFKASGDRMFWIEMAEQGDVAYARMGLNKYRMHPANSTKKFGATGINQREDKKILDYLLRGKYITPLEYKKCADIYVRVHIFEMITDKKLKKDLYKVWNVSAFRQFLYRVKAWRRRLSV